MFRRACAAAINFETELKNYVLKLAELFTGVTKLSALILFKSRSAQVSEQDKEGTGKHKS